MLTLSLGFGAFFSITVLTPLWLQVYGLYRHHRHFSTAMMGILAIFLAPLVAQLATKMDPRPLVFFGVLWMGMWTLYRSHANMDMTFWQISLPMLFQGIGMPLFFVPLTGLALNGVLPREMDSAAGLMNFIRTLSGAFATSMVNTSWESQTRYVRAELVGISDQFQRGRRRHAGGRDRRRPGARHDGMDVAKGRVSWWLPTRSSWPPPCCSPSPPSPSGWRPARPASPTPRASIDPTQFLSLCPALACPVFDGAFLWPAMA